MKYLLIVTNLLTLTLLTICVWRINKLTQPIEKPDPATYSYFSNPNYTEACDLYTSYTGSKNIVMFGNSICYRIQWNELLQRNDMANRGIGADITEGYLHRMESVLNLNPKICFVEGGINDIAIGIPKENTIRNLNAILDTLNAHGVKAILHTVFPVAKSYPDAALINEKVQAMNLDIQNLSNQKQVPLIDLYPLLSESGLLKDEYAQSDGIHLTAKAYLIWKKEIEKILLSFGL
ncbi:MAG: hypothetical protein JNJ58_12590 [Chitinophagaceae bacterium]|nr:hypothetical protein [Chitinophagaceae bacterium]